MKIIEIREMSQPVYDAFVKLMPQLSSSAKMPTWEELDDLIQSKASILFAAIDTEKEDRIVGSLTLAVFRFAPWNALLDRGRRGG